MVELCPVLLCSDRITWGTRRHDGRGARDCLLRAIRRNTLFFPLATGARLAHQYPRVFQHLGPADTRLRTGVYLASYDIVVGCCTCLPTLETRRSALYSARLCTWCSANWRS